MANLKDTQAQFWNLYVPPGRTVTLSVPVTGVDDWTGYTSKFLYGEGYNLSEDELTEVDTEIIELDNEILIKFTPGTLADVKGDGYEWELIIYHELEEIVRPILRGKLYLGNVVQVEYIS